MRKPNKFEAILNLVGNTKAFSVSPEGEFKWLEKTDEGKPTESEIETELTRFQAEWDALEYSRNREVEYPSIQDLVVALYDTDDKSAVEAKRAAVKAKYPKPD